VEPKTSSPDSIHDETGSSSLSRALLPAWRRRYAGGLIDYRRLREMVSMRDVLDAIGWHAHVTSGPQWRGACPVHRSESPASRVFSVAVERGLFQCFKCGAHGNQLDLYALVSGLPFRQACFELAELYSSRFLGIAM